jgi:hypothetical protein
MNLKKNMRVCICAASRAVGKCSRKLLHYVNTCMSMGRSSLCVITKDVARYLFSWSEILVGSLFRRLVNLVINGDPMSDHLKS